MIEWYNTLSILEQIYFWIGIVSTVFLIVQVVMLCFSSFGGDTDIDGDGDIDVDTDSGVSIFTVKSLTAFFAVGSWAGLLTCALIEDPLQWVSGIVAFLTGSVAFVVVVLLMRFMYKMQSNGTIQTEKLVGKRATVYVSIPENRGGRGKITMNAQGKFVELDAMTEGDKIPVDESVEIVSTENECMLVTRVNPAANSEITETSETATTDE